MFKKFLGSILVVVMIFIASTGFACVGAGCGSVFGNYIVSGDQAFSGKSVVSLHGYGNDGAWTNGGAGVYAENTNTAYGSRFFSGQAGYANANANLTSSVCAWDTGLASGARASAEVKANAIAGGLAFSLTGKGATSESTTAVWGQANQGNYANEVGYQDGQGASAGNTSQANFYNEGNYSSSKGKYLAASISCVDGSAKTSGFSNVVIDPSGSKRSAFAETGNTSTGNAGVSGKGSVETLSGNTALVWAYGNSTFEYCGGTQGSGYAMSKTTTSTGSNNFSASSYGFSTAKTTGRPVGNQ